MGLDGIAQLYEVRWDRTFSKHQARRSAALLDANIVDSFITVDYYRWWQIRFSLSMTWVGVKIVVNDHGIPWEVVAFRAQQVKPNDVYVESLRYGYRCEGARRSLSKH